MPISDKPKTIRLTPPQIELLTDIATKPQMYFKNYSRWAKTGGVLVRHGLATMSYCGMNDQEIVITQAGRDEAARRGIGVTRPNSSEKNTQEPCDICSGYGCPGCRTDLAGGDPR